MEMLYIISRVIICQTWQNNPHTQVRWLFMVFRYGFSLRDSCQKSCQSKQVCFTFMISMLWQIIMQQELKPEQCLEIVAISSKIYVLWKFAFISLKRVTICPKFESNVEWLTVFELKKLKKKKFLKFFTRNQNSCYRQLWGHKRSHSVTLNIFIKKNRLYLRDWLRMQIASTLPGSKTAVEAEEINEVFCKVTVWF